ncbi:MAG: glycerate kinase, partial [Caldisericaceae bacterium]|nr:glycerate kinase [Caldisericaceae bacterium]
IAENMLRAALDAVNPTNLILKQCRLEHQMFRIQDLRLDLSQFSNIYVLGAGKASAHMAQALEQLMGPHISEGLIITKYGHRVPTKKIRVLEAGHPVPDKNSLNATGELLKIAEKSTANDLIIFLLSGGGSALLEHLPPSISLGDLQQLNQLLLASGANIEEINAVRKHISLVKGGQLARLIAPAKLVSLIISDVVGNPLSSIASGPTTADETTFQDAWQVIEKYQLVEQLPESIKNHLKRGLAEQISETPKTNEPMFKNVQNIILGSNLLALQKTQKVAIKAGLHTVILTDRLQGEVSEISKLMAAIFESAMELQNLVQNPGCLLLGGEPTVKLKGDGLGGRNQELVLHMLKHLKKIEHPFYFASIGTDGTDGPTDAAGAWIDEQTWKQVAEKKLDVQAYLEHNDSYHFFEKIGRLIKTGPTGTNVMDIMIFIFDNTPF